MKKRDKLQNLLMASGFREERSGIWKHPDFDMEFDFSATGEDCFILRLSQIFSKIGYEKAQADMRGVLGIK